MPKTIPCWDCKGKGSWPIYNNTQKRSCGTCKGGGVLSVYTQAELNEAVKAEREATNKLINKAMKYFMEDNDGSNKGMDVLSEIRARNK